MKKNKGIIISGILLTIMLVGSILIYYAYINGNKNISNESRESNTKTTKSIIVRVVDDKKQIKEYKADVKADFLRQALEQIKGLKIEGEESNTGLFVKKVNGLEADYDTSKAYWSFYVNDEYCMSGVDTQKVNDGDVFKIEYTKDDGK